MWSFAFTLYLQKLSKKNATENSPSLVNIHNNCEKIVPKMIRRTGYNWIECPDLRLFKLALSIYNNMYDVSHRCARGGQQ